MAHAHIVKDSDNHFIIDPITRQLSSNSKKTILIKTDHNSEQFTFELPRYVEGHDMSTCNKVEVHYININSKTRQQSVGIYNVVDFGIDAEDNTKVLGTWLVSREATKYAGSLNFVLRFGCVSADEVEEYSWNTAIYTGISITDGICNTETVVEDYVDILRQWLDALELVAGSSDVYAITDDGIITNLCEKINGVEAHVTELEGQITGFSDQVTDFGDRVSGVEQDVSEIKENLNDSIVKKSELIDLIYPVGSIYMSANNISPQTFLGGTWVSWGAGRVPVGVDSSDTDFNAAEQTGGEKTHTLSVDEMPKHFHEGTYTSPNSSITGRVDSSGEYSDTKYSVKYDVTQGGTRYVETSSGMVVTIPLNYVIESEHGVCPNGGSQPHNNLQPYITCYMWKRTA